MAVLSIITVKLVATALSRELAGSYNSAYGYLQLFGILADFGLYAVAVREVSALPDEEKESALGMLMLLRLGTLTLSLGSALLIAWLLPAWHGTPLPLGISIAALVPFFTLLAGIRRCSFQVAYRMRAVFVAEVSQRILTVVLIGSMVAWGVRASDSRMVYAALLGAGAAGAALLYVLLTVQGRNLLRPRFELHSERMLRFVRLAAPFGAAYLFMALYRQLDITLIALLRDDFELQNASYGFALRIAEMAYLIPTFLLNSALPLLSSKTKEESSGIAGKTLFAVVLLGGSAANISLLWSRPLILLLTRPEYLSSAAHAGSDTALRLLSSPMLLNGLVLYAFYLLLARNRWKALVSSLAVGAACSVGLNILLIPRLGFVGAGISAGITHVLLVTILLPQSIRAIPPRLSASLAVRGASFLACLSLFLFLVRPMLTTSLAAAGGMAALCIVSVVLLEALGIRKALVGKG